MSSYIRIYGDVSPEHERDFLFIKGAFGCKNNGEVMEKMIDRLAPQVRRQASKDTGASKRDKKSPRDNLGDQY